MYRNSTRRGGGDTDELICFQHCEHLCRCQFIKFYFQKFPNSFFPLQLPYPFVFLRGVAAILYNLMEICSFEVFHRSPFVNLQSSGVGGDTGVHTLLSGTKGTKYHFYAPPPSSILESNLCLTRIPIIDFIHESNSNIFIKNF